MRRACFHGAESTGKSTLCAELASDLGCPWVAEYGRAYAEQYGTDFTMEDLLAIARGQDGAMRIACVSNPPLVLLDTDPLMTAAWAEMLFGENPAELMTYEKAEHYLLFEPDVPWEDDGTRLFGTDEAREKFAAIVERILLDADVPFTRVSGSWDQRRETALAAISQLAG